MTTFFYKLSNIIFFLNKMFLEYKYKIKACNNMSFKIGTSKKIITDNETIDIDATTTENRKEADLKIKKIVIKNLKTPDKLLNYIEKNGTKVYKIPYANKLLQIIGEDEGFITELKGLKAFYLNLILNFLTDKHIHISLKTKPMFILRNLPLDPYYTAHQFYIWYSYKLNLPGYDFETQKNFKKIFKSLKNKDISKLDIEKIVNIKEAIKRDNEAIEFVLNLTKENSASKKVLEKILKGEKPKI